MHEETVYDALTAARRRGALGVRRRVRRSAGRRRHHRARRRRRGRAGHLLPHARRRRPGAQPAADRVGHPRAGARGGGRVRPTSPSTCSARPGCCWPAPARSACSAALPSRPRRPRRGRPGVLPRPRRVPLSPWSPRRRRLRPHPGAAAVASTWRLALFTGCATRATRCWPRSPAKGVAELAYHRDHAARWVLRAGRRDGGVAPARAGGGGRGLAADRRPVLAHRRRDGAGRGRRRRRPGAAARGGARGARRGAGQATLTVPDRPADAAPGPPRSARPRAGRAAGRAAGTGPPAPGGDMVTRGDRHDGADPRRWPQRGRPRAADAHPRRPRRAARRAVRGRRRGRGDHADLLRLPGDGGHARRPGARAAPRRVRRRRRPHRARARLEHRLDQRARPPQARRGRHRPARTGAAPSGGPVR